MYIYSTDHPPPVHEHCMELFRLIQGITAPQHNTLTAYTPDQVKALCELISDASHLYILTLTADQKAHYIHELLEFLNPQLCDVFDYKRRLRHHFPHKQPWLDWTAWHIYRIMMQILIRQRHYPMPETVPRWYMEAMVRLRRRRWHVVHQQLMAHIQHPELRLVAMNMVRLCRPVTDTLVSWRRHSYTDALLPALEALLTVAIEEGALDFDERFIDLLTTWEYSDAHFNQYYTERIASEMAHATDYVAQNNVLTTYEVKMMMIKDMDIPYDFPSGTPDKYKIYLREHLYHILCFHEVDIEKNRKG